MRYRSRFSAMVDELGRDPRIVVARVEFGAPATEAAISAALERGRAAITPEITAFYREMNGFTLDWSAKDPKALGLEGEGRGAINLLPLCSADDPDEGGFVLGDWYDTIYFEADQPERRLKPFDFFVNEACAALYPVPGKGAVHYHYCGEETHPTGYSFIEYLERLLVSRGYWYWMQSLCVDLRDGSEASAFKRDAARLFRDFTPEIFRPNTKRGELIA